MKLYKDILENVLVLLLKVYFPTVEIGTWVELYVKKIILSLYKLIILSLGFKERKEHSRTFSYSRAAFVFTQKL